MGSFSIWHAIVLLGAVAVFGPGIWWAIRSASKNPKAGVGGWLAWLIYSLYLTGPLYTIGSTLAALGKAESSYPALIGLASWANYKMFCLGLVIVLVASSVFVGRALHTWGNRAALTLARTYLVIVPFHAWIDAAFANFTLGVVDAAESGAAFAKALVASGIWLAYLGLSKRVKATYTAYAVAASVEVPVPQFAARPPSRVAALTPTPPLNPAPSVVARSEVATAAARVEVDDDALYGVVGLELQEGKRATSTWTRAFAEADGDENRARAIYIKLRVERLKAERTERERRDSQLGAVVQQLAALRDLQSRIALQVSRAERARDTAEAARFRGSVAIGAITEVKAMLEQHPLLAHLRDASGQTVLELAEEKRQYAVVELLLKHGAVSAHGEVGRGAYRGQQVVIFNDGSSRVHGDSTVYPQLDSAVAAIDRALDG